MQVTRPNNILFYFITKLKVLIILIILNTQRNLVQIDLLAISSRILTESAIEHAIHERKERLKQWRLHKVMTVQHISHNSTHVMRRICLWTERSKWVWRRRKKVSITASFRSFEISSVNCWRLSRSLCHVTNWSIPNSSYMYEECLWIAGDPWQPSLPSEFVTLISGRERLSVNNTQ